MNETLHTKFGKAKCYENYYIIIAGVNEGKKLHRAIYEDYHKVTLLPTTIIHHKDGNSKNNCILNLEMISWGEHTKLHHTGRHHTSETIQKISETKTGNTTVSEESREKIRQKLLIKEPHIVKIGFTENGKQRYGIKANGKVLTKSVNLSKLEEKLAKMTN